MMMMMMPANGVDDVLTGKEDHQLRGSCQA